MAHTNNIDTHTHTYTHIHTNVQAESLPGQPTAQADGSIQKIEQGDSSDIGLGVIGRTNGERYAGQLCDGR